MTDAIQKAREALVAARESLTWGHESASALAKIDAALAALDAETPATPADVGEEPVVWRTRGMNGRNEWQSWKLIDATQMQIWARDASTRNGRREIEPLYSATALERVVRDRDEAIRELAATVRKFNCDNADQFWKNITRIRERAARRFLEETK